MMHRVMNVVGVGIACAGLLAAKPGAANEPTRLIQILSTEEFLKLTGSMQALFVGGLLEGMAFTAYGLSWPGYPKWAECVHGQVLGTTTEDVVAFIKGDPSFKEGVASALAKTLGRRCKPAG